MLNYKRAALEIKDVGFYNNILDDIERLLGKRKLSVEEIEKVLRENDEILNSYKQLNVEYNLSNIHLKNIPLEKLSDECQTEAKKINKNLDILRDIEKYTLDFEQSSTLVIIFSIEFFVLFSVQYFIFLLDLKEWQMLIYSIFASSVLIAWWYAKKEKKKFEINNAKFEKLYDETLQLIDKAEKKGCFKKRDFYIEKSDEHV